MRVSFVVFIGYWIAFYDKLGQFIGACVVFLWLFAGFVGFRIGM